VRAAPVVIAEVEAVAVSRGRQRAQRRRLLGRRRPALAGRVGEDGGPVSGGAVGALERVEVAAQHVRA
jgi:hypothetical protein